MKEGLKASEPETLVEADCFGLHFDKFGNLFYAADDAIYFIPAEELDEITVKPVLKYSSQ